MHRILPEGTRLSTTLLGYLPTTYDTLLCTNESTMNIADPISNYPKLFEEFEESIMSSSVLQLVQRESLLVQPRSAPSFWIEGSLASRMYLRMTPHGARQAVFIERGEINKDHVPTEVVNLARNLNSYTIALLGLAHLRMNP